MNRPFVLVIAAVGFLLPGLIFPASAAKEGGTEVLPTASVTSEILESKIAEVEAATDLTDQAKTKLVELYSKALSNLQTARSNAEAAAFARAAEAAPLQIQLLLYLGQLRELDAAERELLDAASAYDEFLIEHLVWLRSVDPIRFEDLLDLPEELQQLLSAAVWLDLGDTFIDQVVHGIAFWLVLLVTAVLTWKHRALIAAIEKTAKRVGKPTTDSFAATLRASVLTLLAAAPLPLLLAVVGWQLQTTAQGTGLYHAIGDTLSRIGLHVYILQLLYTICAPGGLAAVHFRWPKSNLQLLRVEVNRLTWIFVPTVLLTRLAIDLNPTETGNTITRLSLTLGFVALTFFLYRVFHPNRGVLAYLRPRHERGLIFRTYPLRFSLLLLYVPGLAVLTLSGYVYSAFALDLHLDTRGPLRVSIEDTSQNAHPVR